MLFHLHVHENLDTCLDVLQNGKGVRLTQSIALLCQYVFIVGVDLSHHILLGQSYRFNTYLVIRSDLH